MNRYRLLAASTALLAVGLTACGALATASGVPGLDGTSWTSTAIDGRSVRADAVPTLEFADDRVYGSDGCNRYSGTYSASGGKLAVSPRLAGTQMACDADVMAQARAYLAALTGARSYRSTDDRLELTAADGKVLAVFAPQSQSVAGTHWQATGINNGRQAVVSLAKETSVTLSFDAAGRASGSAGCNRYTAAYTQQGAALTFGQAAATRMMCAQPGVMEQEQQYLNALATVATARVEGKRLELRTAGGALAASFVRAD